MSDRTHLHLLRPVGRVCVRCALPLADSAATSFCAVCLRCQAVDDATARWTSVQREAVLTVIHAMTVHMDPEDADEFCRLLAEVVANEH